MTRADALHGVPEEFVHRTRQTLVAAHNRYRRQRGWGALTSPPLPAAALDELAVVIAAVVWDAVREVNRQHEEPA